MAQDSTVPRLVEELMNGTLSSADGGAADIDAGTAMYITGDRQVGIITAADSEADVRKFLGMTIKDFKYGYDEKVTMQTKFRRISEYTAGGTVTAGEYVKFEYSTGAINGQVITWTPGTDDADQIIGMVWVGGADTATVEILEL